MRDNAKRLVFIPANALSPLPPGDGTWEKVEKRMGIQMSPAAGGAVLNIPGPMLVGRKFLEKILHGGRGMRKCFFVRSPVDCISKQYF